MPPTREIRTSSPAPRPRRCLRSVLLRKNLATSLWRRAVQRPRPSSREVRPTSLCRPYARQLVESGEPVGFRIPRPLHCLLQSRKYSCGNGIRKCHDDDRDPKDRPAFSRKGPRRLSCTGSAMCYRFSTAHDTHTSCRSAHGSAAAYFRLWGSRPHRNQYGDTDEVLHHYRYRNCNRQYRSEAPAHNNRDSDPPGCVLGWGEQFQQEEHRNSSEEDQRHSDAGFAIYFGDQIRGRDVDGHTCGER